MCERLLTVPKKKFNDNIILMTITERIRGIRGVHLHWQIKRLINGVWTNVRPTL
jgi:hypothetical protein